MAGPERRLRPREAAAHAWMVLQEFPGTVREMLLEMAYRVREGSGRVPPRPLP
jgi:hypothetical protein